MIKELFVLVKMLFQNKPSDVKSLGYLKVRTMKHFPVKGYRYMMWCGEIITRHEKKDVIDRFKSTYRGRISYNHECIHCCQAITEHGDNWLRFYLAYVWYWLTQNPITHPSHSAYYTSRYEVEAYAMQEDMEYCKGYTRDNLRGKYSISNAKRIYKSLGSNPREWVKYITNL